MSLRKHLTSAQILQVALFVEFTAFVLIGTTMAQGVKSTFVGTVTDSSGAVLANAKISVTNVATNVTISTVTDSGGDFLVPFLDPGTYNVTAELSQFQTSLKNGIKLDVSAKVRVDFDLQLGTATQRVEISGAAPLLETDSTTVGLVVTNEKLEQLPLLGRDYQALAQLSPMAVAPTTNLLSTAVNGLSIGNYYQVAGQRGGAISYTVDGIDDNNVLYQWQSIIPSADTIDEFKVQSHNFSAEYGRGTVQFTTTTKSGTNLLHGTGYDYNRNNHLAATPFFSNRAGQKNALLNENQFGGTIGGPVWLPKVYKGRDKTFFFVGYEGTRYRVDANASARVPNPAWLTGNFSSLGQTIYDPLTTRPDPNKAGSYLRDPFPGNKISPDRFSAVMLAAIPFIPAPNAAVGTPPGSNNYAKVTSTRSDINYWITRIDHNISNNDRVYGRYMQSVEDYVQPSVLPLSGATSHNKDRNAMIAEAHTFSPSIFNELRLGYNRGNYVVLQDGGDGPINYTKDVFHIPNIGGTPITWGLPNLTWTNFTGLGGTPSNPQAALTDTWQIGDSLTIVHGHHIFKTGLDIRRPHFYNFSGQSNRGGFDFNGEFSQSPGVAASGSPFADFLLGYTDQALGNAGTADGWFRQVMYNFYVQDDWRVSSRLTVNLGLRYEHYTPWVENTGKNSRFLFGAPLGTCFQDTNPCPPGTIFQPKPGQPIYDTDMLNFAPRVGLAYSLGSKKKTVIRAAYGMFFTPLEANEDTNNLMNPPNSYRFSVTPNSPITDLTSTYVSNLFPVVVASPAGTILKTGPTWNLPRIQLFSPTSPWQTATVQQWQLTVQREVLRNLIVEFGYVGSHGYHFQRVVNGNQAHLDAPGQLTPITSRTPYPQLASFMRAIQHNAVNGYEAGTLRVERRFSKGLSLVAAYTYAKTMDDYGNTNDFTGFLPQYAYNEKLEKGLAGFDTRNRFTVGYVWELPVGRGKAFFGNMNRIVDGFVGGWQVSGITTMQAGHPLAVTVSQDFSNTGQIVFGRPNIVNPVVYSDPHATKLVYFNANAFANPALGTLGNAARGSLIGPGFDNWDLTIGKYFPIHERARLQFRTEMFNAFNHTQFDGVTAAVGNPAMGQVSSTRAARIIQLALRLSF